MDGDDRVRRQPRTAEGDQAKQTETRLPLGFLFSLSPFFFIIHTLSRLLDWAGPCWAVNRLVRRFHGKLEMNGSVLLQMHSSLFPPKKNAQPPEETQKKIWSRNFSYTVAKNHVGWTLVAFFLCK